MGARRGGGRCALLLAACVAALHCGPAGEAGDSPDVLPGEPGAPAPGPVEADGEPSHPPGTHEPQGPPPTHPPPAPRPALCAPTAGPTRWLQEGEALTVTLACATGLGGPGLRFAVAPLPPGARLDEVSGELRWTPGKDQAAVWQLTLSEQSTGETGTLEVGVADNFRASGNVPVQDPAAYTEEYGLPVFHLSHAGRLNGEDYSPATLVYRGRTYRLEAKYRGASSAEFPKRSYTLKFADDDKFDEPEKGVRDRRRLVLITSFNDNSYLRPRLAFGLWNRMSPDHIQLRTYSAVLYVNGRFQGLYTACDHVSKQLLKRHGLDGEGDLYKAVTSDANFSRLDADGLPKSHLAEGFEKKEGLPESGSGAFDPIVQLTTFVADASAATFRAGWASRVHAPDYEDWWIFNTLILGTDSEAKNAYHYRDPRTGGPWRYIPWDLDASFGQAWDTERQPASRRSDFASDNLLFARMLAEPTIAGPMRQRYRALLAGELRAEVVLGLLDTWAREIEPVALRDEARWQSAYRSYSVWSARTDFTTHREELAYMRRWIRDRWRLLQERLP